MLGEGARTAADAERYERIYADAIEAVGKTAAGRRARARPRRLGQALGPVPALRGGPGGRVWDELYPRILRLALIAANHDLNFAIDAEEADRLVLSLKLLDRLAASPSSGAGPASASSSRPIRSAGREVIARWPKLAEDTGRRLMVRLVKGAYWDSEIKKAQVVGRTDYPVFTTKAATDLSYLVCAQALIDAAPTSIPSSRRTTRIRWRPCTDGATQGGHDRASAPARHGRGPLPRRRGSLGKPCGARLCSRRRP
jgi:RHH-type proline utilization regulon transcriptional repressor/proline dehydrogenase/delta 1-pyrroline-5-carboxylate dehydrogenase